MLIFKVFQRPKTYRENYPEILRDNKMEEFEWPSQFPDLNIIELLWSELESDVRVSKQISKNWNNIAMKNNISISNITHSKRLESW